MGKCHFAVHQPNESTDSTNTIEVLLDTGRFVESDGEMIPEWRPVAERKVCPTHLALYRQEVAKNPKLRLIES